MNGEYNIIDGIGVKVEKTQLQPSNSNLNPILSLSQTSVKFLTEIIKKVISKFPSGFICQIYVRVILGNDDRLEEDLDR